MWLHEHEMMAVVLRPELESMGGFRAAGAQAAPTPTIPPLRPHRRPPAGFRVRGTVGPAHTPEAVSHALRQRSAETRRQRTSKPTANARLLMTRLGLRSAKLTLVCLCVSSAGSLFIYKRMVAANPESPRDSCLLPPLPPTPPHPPAVRPRVPPPAKPNTFREHGSSHTFEETSLCSGR